LLAADSPLHRSFHRHDAAGDSGCVLCLFLHGQVNAVSVATALAVFTFSFLGAIILADSPVRRESDHLLPPGRAPPRLSFTS
jgi:hypothetical protein